MQTPNRSGQTGHKPTAHEDAFLIGYAIARARPEYVGQVLRGVLRAANEINEAEAANETGDQLGTPHDRTVDGMAQHPRYVQCVPSGRRGYDHE